MKNAGLIAICTLALTLGGCGEDAPTPAPDEPMPAPQEPTPLPQTPEQLGQQVGDIYAGTMEDVIALLEDRPEPSVARSELEALRESAIEKLVRLGWERERLGVTQRSAMDAVVRQRVFGGSRELMGSFIDAHGHYTGVDREFGNFLSSFNTITQYSIFELLKKQAPKEAERLGIE